MGALVRLIFQLTHSHSISYFVWVGGWEVLYMLNSLVRIILLMPAAVFNIWVSQSDVIPYD